MRAIVWLLAGCAACGRIGFDESDPLVGPATATVHTFSDPLMGRVTPLAGATVWSSHADGSVLEVAITDATGSATLEIEPGASVSGAPMRPGNKLFTKLGVQDGDEIRLSEAPSLYCDNTVVGTATLDWSLVAGATAYEIPYPCKSAIGNATPPVQVSVHAGDPSTYDLIIGAYDSSTNLVASAFRSGAPWSVGATITIGQNEWQPTQVHPIMVDGLPSEITDASMTLEFHPGSLGDSLFPLSVANGKITTSAPVPVGVAVDAYVDTWSASGRPVDIYLKTTLTPPLPATIVATYDPLPLMDSLTFDSTARRVAWSASPGSANRVSLRVDTAAVFQAWTVEARPGIAELMFPAVPDGMTDPLADGTAISIEYARFSTLTEDAIRAAGLGAHDDISAAALVQQPIP